MIYIVTIFALLALFIIEYNKKSIKTKRRVFWISTAIFFFLLAFRGNNVGGDTYEYCKFYLGKISSTYGMLYNPFSQIEIGFIWFCKLFNPIFTSSFAFIFLSSLFSTFPFFLLVKKYSAYPSLSYFYVMCSNFMVMVVNLQTNLRQDIAIGYILLSIYLLLDNQINKKRLVLIVCLLTLSFLTHKSIYLILPFGLLIWFIPFNRKISLLLIVASVVASVFYTSGIETIVMNLFSMSFFDSNEMLTQIANYVDNDKYGLTGKAGQLIVLLPSTFWAVYNVYFASEEEMKNIFMKSIVIACVFINLGSSFPLSFRMVFAFQILSVIYIPKRICINTKLMVFNLLALSWIMYRLFVMVSTPSFYNNENHLLPYKFIWE